MSTQADRDLRALYFKPDLKCGYCGKPLATIEDLTLDHVVSRALGGWTTEENLMPSCFSCNSSKSGSTLEQWRWWWKVKTSPLAGVISGAQARRLCELGVQLPINHEFKFHFELTTEAPAA